MPPEASSRSRTYFPNSWGNTRFADATALGLALVCIACTTAEGTAEVHEIRAHFPPSCPPAASDPVEFELEALGDFDPSAETREVVSEREGRAPLVVPSRTRVVTMRASGRSGTWTGMGEVAEGGDIDVALFPRATCTLAGGAGDPYPGPAGGEALGYHPGSRTALLAGGHGPSAVATGALAFDVATGRVRPVPAGGALRARRARAVVTPFGANLLVSGGLDPAGVPLASADVFDPQAGVFDDELVDLESARGRHAAVELSSGETLLVGGVGSLGAPVRTLEVLSPVTRKYRISDLADLAAARLDPVVLRLSDSRILVAGGVDAASAPIDSIEWFEPDASRAARAPIILGAPDTPTLGRAFAPMPGGGVLVVGGCTLVPEGTPPTCGPPCAEGRGCPSAEVLWISGAGEVRTLPSLDRPIAEPRLVSGEEGRPFVVVDRPSGTTLRRFEPWLGRFVVPEGEVPSPMPGARFIAPDPGLFLWLDPGPEGAILRAFRHGTRSAFSAAVGPLLLADTAGTSPDRPTGPAIELDPSAAGGVLLGEPGASLVVTDTTYGDVFLTLEVEGPSLPLVWLGSSTLGGAACPWPAQGSLARVERREQRVTLVVGEATRKCDGPDGRVTVRLESPGEAVRVRALTVRRSDAG